VLQIKLSENAVRRLLAQDPRTESKGGFQKLLIGMQRQLDSQTGMLRVSSSQVEKIERYRKQYGRGGWQDILDEVLKLARNP
jgi:hypothetical protein